MVRRRHVQPLLLVALGAALAGCATTVRTSATFDRDVLRDVGLMPPEVQFLVRTATAGVEARPERSEEVAAVLTEALQNVLARTPIRAVPVVLSDSLLAAHPDLAAELTRARASAGARADSASRTRPGPLALAVDPESGRFADVAGTDHLLFVRAVAFGSSAGSVARDAAVAVVGAVFGVIAVRPQSGLALDLLLVDANTAEVVWYNRSPPGAAGANPFSVRSVQEQLRTLLEPLAPARLRRRAS